MKIDFNDAIENKKSLQELKPAVIETLKDLYRLYGQIIYVQGVISSDGETKIAHNLRVLQMRTARIQKVMSVPVFSSTDIFTANIYSQIEETHLPRNLREYYFRNWWGDIIQSGFISHICQTPRHQISEGCNFEEYAGRAVNLDFFHYRELFPLKDDFTALHGLDLRRRQRPFKSPRAVFQTLTVLPGSSIQVTGSS